MFAEYAVDPRLLGDEANVRFIRESFSSATGRLISDPFNDWKNQSKSNFYNALRKSDYSPKKRKQIIRNFEKIIDSRILCCRPQSIVTDEKEESWDKKILPNHAKYPFSAILSDEQHEKFHSPSNFLLSEPLSWARHENNMLLVERQARAIVDVMMPLLRLSSKVQLIDPYFDISKSAYTNVLKEIINRRSEFNFGQGINHLVVYMREECYEEGDFERDWIPPYFVKARPIFRNRIHDRFVMTENGCMQYGHGLGEHKKSIKVNVSRVSLEKAKEIRIDLDNPNQR